MSLSDCFHSHNLYLIGAILISFNPLVVTSFLLIFQLQGLCIYLIYIHRHVDYILSQYL
jgi:hypothetical protein